MRREFAFYSATLTKFSSQSSAEIFGELAQKNDFGFNKQQINAWLTQIDVLKDQLVGILDGHIHFEFIIPRMGKRADCVIVLAGVVFVLEFKVNSDNFDRYAIDQAHDYALDLKNFHRGSHNAAIVPVLVATKSAAIAADVTFAADQVAAPLQTGSAGVRVAIESVLAISNTPNLDPDQWVESGYQPTPTIIEAAQALYQNHDVQAIARSDAGAKNLQATDTLIAEIIERSKTIGRKSICFITGVPGAGKTLAGLNIAAKRASEHADEHSVFLSGNGPLVNVLREALARDQSNREGIKKKDAQRKVRAFVQNIHHFRDEYLQDPNVPIEKVVVFDEAQRAWTKEQASKFMQTKRGHASFSQSEPEFLISVMDRHSDWCTIVCLEAGLLEWLTALQDRFHDWDVHASALLDDPHYTVAPEAVRLLRTDRVTKHPNLHLSISMRSFRAEQLSAFVGAVLDGNAEDAKQLFTELRARYPIWLTRDLKRARGWLRAVSRGSERFGLVASSGAGRLRPEGIHIKSSIDPESWFLNDRIDVRSSYYLEDVATEFDIQGLELDWVGVCWDANLRYGPSDWESHAFRGTKWQNVRTGEKKLYLTNAYRVLLTRARQGMVIFVPEGDDLDLTRPKEFYDGTYEFLKRCGLPITEPSAIEPAEPRD